MPSYPSGISSTDGDSPGVNCLGMIDLIILTRTLINAFKTRLETLADAIGKVEVAGLEDGKADGDARCNLPWDSYFISSEILQKGSQAPG